MGYSETTQKVAACAGVERERFVLGSAVASARRGDHPCDKQ